MYLAYAAASAVFAGLTAVLAKIGVKDMDSTLATACARSSSQHLPG